MVLYYSFCCFAIIFAYFAQKKNNKMLFWISTAFICFLAGMRGESVGLDTTTYYQYIKWADMGILEIADFGFYYATRVLLKVCHSVEFVVAAYSVTMVCLITSRLWMFRNKASYPLMLLIFLSFYFQLSMNIMRQFFAIAIVFYSTRFLEERKYITFSLMCILAATFHISVIMGLAYVFIYMVFREHKSLRKYIIYFLTLCALPFVVVYVHSRFGQKIGGFFSSAVVNIGFMLVIKLFVLLMFCVSRLPALRRKTESSTTLKSIVCSYFLGIVFTSFGYFFTYLERLGFVFMMFEPVCLGIMCKKSINSKLFKPIVLFLCAYLIYINFRSNSNGVFPYVTILGS